ncbi:metal-dependent hydrolase, partial [Psychrobacter sp. 1U2]
MANFNTHLNVAFMVSGTLSLAVYKAGLVGDSGFLMCVALGTIGGLLPDLDSDHSTPIKLGFNIISFVFAFGLV